MRRIVIFLVITIFSMVDSFAQSSDIKGVIHNEHGKVITGVNVTLKSINNADKFIGVISLKDGFFVFNDVKNGKYKIDASHISYNSSIMDIYVKKDTVIDFILKDKSYNLEEVVLTINKVEVSSQKTTHLIDQGIRKLYTNGFDIMDEVPKILVDNSNRQLSSINGNRVLIQINGINGDSDDLLALSVKEIIRIEYYDIPPARFSQIGVGSVVNVITDKSKSYGTKFTSNFQNAFTTGFGNDLISLKHSFGKSQLSLKYAIKYRKNKNSKVDEELEYIFEDIFYKKTKIGIPKTLEYKDQLVEFNFLNSDLDNYTFASKLSIKKFDYSELIKQDGYEYFPNNKENTIINNKYENYLKYTLDLYYAKKIGDKQNIILNAVGFSYISSFDNIYNESIKNNQLFENETNINSTKNKIILDLNHNINFHKVKINSGVRYSWEHSPIISKHNGVEKRDTILLRNINIYSEATGKISNFSYTISAGINRNDIFQNAEINNHYVSFTPKLKIGYTISDNSSLNLNYFLTPIIPKLGELNNSIIMQDSLVAYSGNSDLRQYSLHSTELIFNYNSPKIKHFTSLKYKYASNPILPYFKRENDFILQTLGNQIFSRTISLSSYFKLYPFSSRWMEVSFYGSVFYQEDKGTQFLISSLNYRYIPRIKIRYDKWLLDLFYQSMTYFQEGQLLNGHPSAGWVELTRKNKNVSISIGVRYPFFDAWKRSYKTDDSSIVKSHTVHSIGDYSNLIYMNLIYSFGIGSNKKTSKKINNMDSDYGKIDRKY